jgi:hypothetical protein
VPSPSPSPSPIAGPKDACSKSVPFTATDVPEGWSTHAVDGPGGGGTLGYAHFEGPDQGNHVNIVRGESPYAFDVSRHLVVLENPASGGVVEDGYAAVITACSTRYALVGYGITETEFFDLATSLAYASEAAPLPSLPRLPAAAGPEPSVIAVSNSGRIALIDSGSARVVRYLTQPATPQHGVGEPVYVATTGSDQVWFTQDDGTNCGADLYEVPTSGGLPTKRAAGNPGMLVQLPSVDGSDGSFAYAESTCHYVSGHGTSRIVVHRSDGEIMSVGFASDHDITAVALRQGRLAVTIQAREGDHRPQLYVANVREASSRQLFFGEGAQVPARRADCFWGSPTWSDLGLLLSETCDEDPGSPTRVVALDATTLRPMYAGPVIATDLGINSMDSDEKGHVIVWRSGGDMVGGFVKVNGMATKELVTGSCASIDPQPDPCPRFPTW